MITKAEIVHSGHLHTQRGICQAYGPTKLVTKQPSDSMVGGLLAQGFFLGMVHRVWAAQCHWNNARRCVLTTRSVRVSIMVYHAQWQASRMGLIFVTIACGLQENVLCLLRRRAKSQAQAQCVTLAGFPRIVLHPLVVRLSKTMWISM